MQIATVGLGRMGATRVRRLLRAGHDRHVHYVSADAVAALVDEGRGAPGRWSSSSQACPRRARCA